MSSSSKSLLCVYYFLKKKHLIKYRELVMYLTKLTFRQYLEISARRYLHNPITTISVEVANTNKHNNFTTLILKSFAGLKFLNLYFLFCSLPQQLTLSPCSGLL